ncbi:hemagglutinin, partial [Klebsiella pasteurii]
AGNAICIDDMLNGISSASGYDMLGRQIGFDISREYELMGQNAYKKFDTCGWESGAGCGLKLWASESLPDALILGLGYGAGKLLKPVVSNYISEVTALSRKGGTQKLIDAANKPINGQGLSAAARAWEKHAGRPGGTFEPLKGNVQQKNTAAEGFIRDVLNDKSVVRKSLSGGAVEYRLPNGKGIRFNSDGSFNTVLDPKV